MNERVLDFFFPPRCGGCGALGQGACSDCIVPDALLRRTIGRFDVTALSAYTPPVRRIVHALKDGRRDVADALGVRLAKLLEPGDVIVPVPTTAARRRIRGIDGVTHLAAIAARAAGASVIAALTCVTSDHQRGKTRGERIAAHGRFRCHHVLDECEVVMVDDVCTTGATLLDCERAVIAAGGRVRRALVVALVDAAQEWRSRARSAGG